MTRTPRRASDGKPLPAALREHPEEFVEEPTVPDRMPSDEELRDHLYQRAEAGQGDDEFSYRRGPR